MTLRRPSQAVQASSPCSRKYTYRTTRNRQGGYYNLLPRRERAEVGGRETRAGCGADADEERVDEADGVAAVASVEDGCRYQRDEGAVGEYDVSAARWAISKGRTRPGRVT